MVLLTVDFSNGACRTLMLPLGEDPSVCGVLESAATVAPGLSYGFEASGTDRGGREIGQIVSVDGVSSRNGENWEVSVNGRTAAELRRVVDGSVSDSGEPALEPGDSVNVRLVR